MEPSPALIISGAVVAATCLLIGGVGSLAAARAEAKRTQLAEVDAFKQFAARFGGWVKGEELIAPPDMTELLGTEYESAQQTALIEGEVSYRDYERKVQPITERREWERHARARYQQHWRAEVGHRIEWAGRAGVATRRALIASLLVDNPQADDLKELAGSVEEIAAAL